MQEIRQAVIYGVRPQRTFEQAAARFVLENQHKQSLDDAIGQLKSLLTHIGDKPLENVHMGTMQPWIEHRRREEVTIGTINHGLKVVRRILNLASSEWLDEHGLTWLKAAPKIRLLTDTNKRQPYPLNWDEQVTLFQKLPTHLAQMALFAVNTGGRDSEICNLQWAWEQQVPELVVLRRLSVN